MLIKKYKFLILIGFISFLLYGCNTFKEAFDPQRKNSSEEFLVEKKSPLSMPPDFEKLPVPQNDKQINEDQDKDIEFLIIENDKNSDQPTDTESSDKDFFELILDKIKNN